MDSSFYESHILKSMLDDNNTYKHLAEHSDENIIKKLKTCVKKYNKSLTKDEIKYISEFEYKSSNIYGMSKIYKCKTILSEIKQENKEYIKMDAPTDLKFRPIIAGPICPTSR